MKVFIIAALTVDGFIARHNDELANWTSPEDKQHFVQHTKRAGLMVMGARTFDTIGKALPGRKTIVYTTRPDDYKGKGVETTSEDPAELVNRLAGEGYDELAVCGGSKIYDLFLQAKVVTDLYLTIEPKLFGQGVGLLSSVTDQTLTLESVDKLHQNGLALHYKIA